MNDLDKVALGIGLQDGINPCVFMASAVFIALGLWVSCPLVRTIWFRIIFVLTYFFSIIGFNFWLGQIFVLRKDFIFAAKIIYFVLGVCAFILGVLFLKDWFLSYREHSGDARDKKNETLGVNPVIAVLVTFVSSLLLGALATLWPIDRYILLLIDGAIAKGLWQSVLPLLGVYVLMSMWPLLFVWAFLSIKNLRPSSLKILFAAVFFIASSAMILLFK